MQVVGDLVPLFRREFELCKVAEGELVALLTEPTTPLEYIAAAGAAVGTLGAQVFEVSVGGLGWNTPTPVKGMGASAAALAHPSELNDAVAASLLRAQFVVDLVPETIIHVPLREKLRDAGVRILTVVEAPDALERLFPPEGIKDAVNAMAKRVATCWTLRVESATGTGLTYQMTGADPVQQYGYADEPGRWDHWPSAMIAAYPVDGTAEGVLVLSPGDIVYPFKRFVADEVRLEIREGYVTQITGGLDAFLVRDYLESWEEPEVFATSHVGFGMLPRAQWSALAFYEKHQVLGMDGRSVRGNFLFSTGPNRFTGRHVEAHLDIPVHGQTVYFDDELVIDEGTPVAAEFDVAQPV
jgi:2,5-dihydroxypyridine 5,6-dioxygenase